MNIKFKRSMILLSLFFIFILSIGFISASDMENNNDLNFADSNQPLDDEILSEVSITDEAYGEMSDSEISKKNDGASSYFEVSQAADGEIDDVLADDSTGTSFEDIQDRIDNANEDDVIELSGEYAGSSSIKVNKSLSIKGISEGTSLDLNNQSQILVTAPKLTFENLIFTNKNNFTIFRASNIIINGSSQCNFINCTFKDCSSIDNGIIYSESSNLSFENCAFEDSHGTVIYSTSQTLSVIGCSFYRCFDGDYIIYWKSGDGLVKDSNFTFSGTNEDAVNFENSSIINCKFYNVPIAHELSKLVVCQNLINSSFENCICKNGDGVCVLKQNGGVVENCTFKNSSVVANFTIKQIGSYYGNVSLFIKVVDAYCGNVVANQSSIITFFDLNTHNDMFNRTLDKTDENGELIYNLPFDVMECGARIETFGVYTWSAGSISKIKISKAPTVLTPSKYSVPYNSSKTFNIKLINKMTNKPVSNVKLKIKVYTGTKYKTYSRTTDKNGMIKFKASTFAAGTHKVIITGTNKNYKIDKTQATIKITKASTSVSAPKVTKKYRKSKYFKVTVKSKVTKKPVKTLKLKLKVYTGKKYKTHVIKTNSKGIAKLNTKSLKIGKHKVIISSGSKNYKVSKKSTIVIKR